ncbi:MAG: division/cell wall cluster transcriptional repressor MraZ [Actinobacteria bacterium]|nr:division/cell wall cluster transcriptional repressor MraZ [Cyanobacteriota bacterium]MCL6087632.1 division/cell wall cluster transcriptional repressor MraZ [Actinomycetota bacterium]
MFLGEYQRSLDNKSRLFIPVKFRENLSKNIAIISKGYDEKCLFLYSIENWTELVKRITALPVTKINQEFSRWFFKSAHEEVIDAQGRIKIDKSLAEFAELKKDVVLVGVSTRAEIWSRQFWESYSKSADEKFTGSKKAFEDLGF